MVAMNSQTYASRYHGSSARAATCLRFDLAAGCDLIAKM